MEHASKQRIQITDMAATRIPNPQIKERIIRSSPTLKYNLFLKPLPCINTAIITANTSQTTPNKYAMRTNINS